MTKAELLERLKKATGPSLDIDNAICRLIDPSVRLGEVRPVYTADIGAALPLVEKVLPGLEIEVGGSFQPGHLWTCTLHTGGFLADEPVSANAPTAPLAILVALFTALVAQEKEHG